MKTFKTFLAESTHYVGCYVSDLILRNKLDLDTVKEMMDTGEYPDIKLCESHAGMVARRASTSKWFYPTSDVYEELLRFTKEFTKIRKNPVPNGIYYSSDAPEHSEKLHNFDKFPAIIKTDLLLSDNCLFTSLSGIHKHFKSINGAITVDGKIISSSILGALLIPGVTDFIMRNLVSDIPGIINKYLPNTIGNDAVFECQNELMEAGYMEYAQL